MWRRELKEAMSELSEVIWAAGWLDGWEYQLWHFAMNHPSEAMVAHVGRATPQRKRLLT